MSIRTPQPVIDSEAGALFNPAFCAVLLNKASAGYEAKAGGPMPIIFAFLILPNALHKPTRDALPATTATLMWGWLRDNPLLLLDFADRMRTFQPVTATAITYGLRHTVLSGSLGFLGAANLGRRPRSLYPTTDWLDCIRAADFLGRWFGGTDTDEATTMTRWGVRL